MHHSRTRWDLGVSAKVFAFPPLTTIFLVGYLTIGEVLSKNKGGFGVLVKKTDFLGQTHFFRRRSTPPTKKMVRRLHFLQGDVIRVKTYAAKQYSPGHKLDRDLS